ncbi:PPP4R2-domain-containing protein [Obba rivulosa]|uniref:PPP4R2-domain-containing protein n=1 Tax=Obba rivulosa TaxID=1052685 RepID=A0A8E2DSK7_9APHY|nr:PPP4R2-domain-containing protein [Obba rivulosa]
MADADAQKVEKGFQWEPEYHQILEDIADTDIVNVEWSLLKDIIKYKVEKNIALFLTGGFKPEDKRPKPLEPPQPGGLKLPPFPPRPRNESSPNEAPKTILSEKEAEEFKNAIFELLDQFESSPPFTIQRICELCLRPNEHYNYLGKYLRAVERSLLVTSTWDAFPAIPEEDGKQATINQAAISSSSISTPATPMFSPIPFLHEDARRSSSRSPPPSPLVLPAMASGGTFATLPHAGAEGAETKALGLVDELDDPSPGHLSDHPQPISATTDVDKKPLFGSLEQRFVKARTDEVGSGEQKSTGGESVGGEKSDEKSAE